jgi:hypothetical protein
MTKQTINSLPGADANFLTDLQTFIRDEIVSREQTRLFPRPSVVSGGIGSTDASLTHTISACIGFPSNCYVAQDAVSHTYTATKDTYIYLRDDDDKTVTITDYAITYDEYFVFAEYDSGTGSDQPACPIGCLELMKVITNGTSIISVTDLRTLTNVVDVKQFGAKGNSNTDDIDAFTNAISALVSVGGGTLIIPALSGNNYYACSAPIFVYDNIRICGEGKSSWIHNTATSGYTKNTFIIGNTAGLGDTGSILDETYYNISTLIAGTKIVTFDTPSDSNNFSAGDIIFLRSYSTHDSGDPLYVNTNIVESVSSGTLTMRYPVLDTFTSSDPNFSQIALLTGGNNGIDGSAQYMPRNVVIENIRISNKIESSSGWYCLYLSCIESRFFNIWLDGPVNYGVSKGIGANGTSYCAIENVWINFYAACLDLAYFTCGNYVRNIWGTKTDTATIIGDLGISLHEPGGGNVIENVTLDLKGASSYGISTWEQHHVKISKCFVTNLGGVYIGYLIGPDSIDISLFDCLSVNTGGEGVFLSAGCKNCRVENCSFFEVGNYGIRVGENASDYIIVGNTLGRAGERAITDIIYDVAYGQNGIIEGNTTFTRQQPIVDFSNYVTTSTGEETLFTYTINQNTFRVGQALHITASGYRSGVNGAKQLLVKFGSQTINQIDWSSAETGHFRVEVDILVETAYKVRATSYGMMGTEIEDQNYIRFDHPAAAGDADITITGNCLSAGDYLYLRFITVKAINDQVCT